MMGSNTSTLDPSDFTDPIGAQDAVSNSTRRANPYNVYGNKTVFDVIVLTQPLPLSYEDASAIIGGSGNTTDLSQGNNSGLSFRGRIVGSAHMSPHISLPNPCSLPDTTRPDIVAKIAALHTLFVSTGNIVKIPSIGDLVRVTLEPAEYEYNLQYAYFDEIKISPTVPANATVEALADCSTLATMFDAWDIGDFTTNMDFSTAVAAPASVTSAVPLGLPAAILHNYYMLAKNFLWENRTYMFSDGLIDWEYKRRGIPAEHYIIELVKTFGKNLGLGIAANVLSESGFNPFVVSGASTESSIGMFQCNVQRPGWIGKPTTDMISRAASLSDTMRVKADATVVPYFAGSLYVVAKFPTMTYPWDTHIAAAKAPDPPGTLDRDKVSTEWVGYTDTGLPEGREFHGVEEVSSFARGPDDDAPNRGYVSVPVASTAGFPMDYGIPQDVWKIYCALSHSSEQLKLVSHYVCKMLAETSIPFSNLSTITRAFTDGYSVLTPTDKKAADTFSAAEWANWFQIYFEQPANFNARGGNANYSALGVSSHTASQIDAYAAANYAATSAPVY